MLSSEMSKNRSEYIRSILARRGRERSKRSDRKNIMVYDLDMWDVLSDIARVENTTMSAIINNLYEEFLLRFDSPQRTMDSFETERRIPALDAPSAEWRLYLQSLGRREYKDRIDVHLNNVMRLCNERYREL